MKKGFLLTPLMVLKRVGNSEGVISRPASGLCLDFPIEDSSANFACTEGGRTRETLLKSNNLYFLFALF